MAIMASMVASLSTYYPDSDPKRSTSQHRPPAGEGKTIAAFAYKKSVGQPLRSTRATTSSFTGPANFLRMMFAVPAEEYEVRPRPRARR